MKKGFYSFIFFILPLFLISLTTEQSIASTTRLSPINGGNLKAPTKIAIDKEGKLYVVTPSENRLIIYSRNGAYLNDIKGLNKPSGVGVDASNRIYISSENGYVSVYNADLTFSHKLGSGEGEFIRPCAIAVDTSGDIYVIDSMANIVKVYDSNGAYKFSFGGSGNGNGQFNFPTSITIDEIRGEVLISDLQVITTSNGLIGGARVQVFDRSGIFERSFGSYGIADSF